jgi:putative ABC transport system permease protein
MRTLGFPAHMIFLFIAGEALLMSVAGGLVGVLLARAVVSGDMLAVSSFIPAFAVSGKNVAIGVALSVLIGVLAGIVPATMASRLRIVDALRRVA